MSSPQPQPTTFPRVEILVGPFFVSAPKTQIATESVASIGAAMEFATLYGSAQIPLFKKICPYAVTRCQLSDIVIHESELPCDVKYMSCFASKTSTGDFVPLDSVLAEMFRCFKIGRTVVDVLKDLTETVVLDFDHHRKPALLHDFLEREGFGLSWITPYGRRVNTVVCWCPPNERGKSEPGGIMVSWIDFRPKPDGTLGKGVWKTPWNESVSSELCREFRSRFHHVPVDILTDAGKNKLLAEFEWTPLARLTAKQARAARITFIREHPELKQNLKNLAEAMLKAGLYAESTTGFQVAKFLPSLILESGI